MAENAVDNYGWSTTDGPASCGYVAPRVLEELTRLRVKRVLDLGAGNGALCAQMSAQGYEVCGVEYDGAGVDLAREKYPHIPFFRMGVQDSTMPIINTQALFDVVVSTEVIEHLFSPHLLPMFAQDLLVPNGWLIVTTPYHGYFKNLALSVLNKWDHHHTALWHGGHIKFWSKKTISRLLNDHGFEVEKIDGVGRFPYLWKSMIVVARKKS